MGIISAMTDEKLTWLVALTIISKCVYNKLLDKNKHPGGEG